MGNLNWTPAITDDPGLNRSLADLASRLTGVDALLSVLSAPVVTRTTVDLKITDQSFIDCRGSGGFTVQLPSAKAEGQQRASLVWVQNNANAAVTISVQARETVNLAKTISVAPGTMAIAMSNGDTSWLVLVTVTPGLPGHIVDAAGVPFAQRGHLNFVGATVADNPGTDSTDVTIAAAGTAGHVIQDNGTDKTQRAKLDFIGFTVADDAVNNRTKVTAPAAGTAGHIIQSSEASLTQRSKLDFTGMLKATDNSGNDRSEADALMGWTRMWNPNVWNVAADLGQAGTGASAVTLGYGAVSSQTNLLFAWPVFFDRAGTITAIGRQFNSMTSTTKAWFAIYGSATSAPWLPTTRLFDVEKTSGSTLFNFAWTQTLSLAVARGDTLWFACVFNNDGPAGGFTLHPSNLRTLGGTDWDGATSGAPTVSFFGGYKHSFTYAQPPTPFPGSGAPTQMKSNESAARPVFMFKFQPS